MSGVYGGQLEATARTPLPAVFAINRAALHDEPQAAGRGERTQLAPPAELDNLRTRSSSPSAAGRRRRPDEGGSDRVRRPWDRGADNVPVAEDLADALGAELAASRPVIDSGWLPKVRQIGKSGAR